MAELSRGTATPRPESMRWEVPVLDAHDRHRMLIVVVSKGRLLVLPPPGEAFIVPASSDDQLFDAIRAARTVAQHMSRQVEP